jgi:uncharacterized protein YggE
LLVALLVPAVLHAQVIRDSTITVSASRNTRVAPDRASMYVLVEGSAETPADAVARVELKIKAVGDAIRALASKPDVDRPVIFSTGPAAQPNGFPQASGPPSNLSRAVMRVQTNRVDQIAQIAAAALAAGAAGVSSITFEASASDSVRRTRMADALAVARADATALATSLEGHLGALIDVTSNSPNLGFVGPTQLNFDSRFYQPPQVPEVNIMVNVTVRYKLVR